MLHGESFSRKTPPQVWCVAFGRVAAIIPYMRVPIYLIYMDAQIYTCFPAQFEENKK